MARPSKTVELRISGQDDSVTSNEVAEVLGATGECSPHDVKVGEIKVAPNGLGTCWVRCPVKAGKAILATPRIRVGWSSCRAILLPSRGLQCHKCLATGHVQAKCSSPIDRSGCCYRCGGIGHLAKNCINKAGCPVCKDAGKPAEHRIGAKGCLANKPQRAPLSTKGRKEGGSTAVPTPPPTPALDDAELPLQQRERNIRNRGAGNCVEMREVEKPREQQRNAP